MWDYYFPFCLIANKKRPPIVTEFYDITSLYADKSLLKKNWPAKEVDLDLKMEEKIFHHSDGVITRFEENIFPILNK